MVLLAGSAAFPGEEERPKIFFEKKIFADTSGGKKSYYEVHTVSEGECLWKIMERRAAVPPEDYSRYLKAFRKANPGIADPGRLKSGQKILMPANFPTALTDPAVAEGRAVAHRVAKGDNLTKLLKGRNVSGAELSMYLEAVKELNRSIRDVNLILAGRTIVLPTEGYFSPSAGKGAETAAAEKGPGEGGEVSAAAGTAALQGEGAASPAAGEAAKPESQIRAATASTEGAAAVMAGAGAGNTADARTAALPKPPYRGLLTDVLAGLGEKLVDRGKLYLPVPSGGEVVLDLEEYPVAQFSSGIQVLVDFRGTLPQKARGLILDTWKNYRVVSFEGAGSAGEMIRRLLAVSGYHSVKDGAAHPLVIGEGIAVSLPARWVVLRTPESLLKGEVILVKEVPEKPSEDLSAVLRYADRVGIRVLPYATDPSAMEGFLVGIDKAEAETEPPRLAVPREGLPALDFALDFLEIPRKEGERMQIGGKKDAYRLILEHERIFEAGGRSYVVDSGDMTDGVRAMVRDAGFQVFRIGKDESGREVFQRLLKEAGISSEVRREYLLSGGDKAEYSVRATGTFLSTAQPPEAGKSRTALLFGGRAHTATRTLLRDLGVDLVEW